MEPRDSQEVKRIVSDALGDMKLRPAERKTAEAGYRISRHSIAKLKDGQWCEEEIVRRFARAFLVDEQRLLEAVGHVVSPSTLAARVRRDLKRLGRETQKQLNHLSDLVGELETATTTRTRKEGQRDKELVGR